MGGAAVDFQEEINKLVEKAEELRSFLWTEKELKQLQYEVDFFEARIQAMIRATIRNLTWYSEEGWKKFND